MKWYLMLDFVKLKLRTCKQHSSYYWPNIEEGDIEKFTIFNVFARAGNRNHRFDQSDLSSANRVVETLLTVRQRFLVGSYQYISDRLSYTTYSWRIRAIYEFHYEFGSIQIHLGDHIEIPGPILIALSSSKQTRVAMCKNNTSNPLEALSFPFYLKLEKTLTKRSVDLLLPRICFPCRNEIQGGRKERVSPRFTTMYCNLYTVTSKCLHVPLDYRKFPKYSDTQNICCDHSKIWTMWLYHRVMSPNDADGMANSVDPDQTAPLGAVWSGSALFALAYMSENLGSLR